MFKFNLHEHHYRKPISFQSDITMGKDTTYDKFISRLVIEICRVFYIPAARTCQYLFNHLNLRSLEPNFRDKSTSWEPKLYLRMEESAKSMA